MFIKKNISGFYLSKQIGEFTITTHNTTQPTESSPCSPPSAAQQKKEKPVEKINK